MQSAAMVEAVKAMKKEMKRMRKKIQGMQETLDKHVQDGNMRKAPRKRKAPNKVRIKNVFDNTIEIFVCLHAVHYLERRSSLRRVT